jgi:hypothetical protein
LPDFFGGGGGLDWPGDKDFRHRGALAGGIAARECSKQPFFYTRNAIFTAYSCLFCHVKQKPLETVAIQRVF